MNTKVVVVTGGTRGIGAAIAEEFWQTGAQVIITGTNAADIDRRNQVAQARQQFIQADFTDAESLAQFRSFMARLQRLDVLINNAGINIIKPVEQVTITDFDTIAAVNYKAPYLLCQTAADVMRKQQGGRIVNIGSIWSIISKPSRSLYAAAKAGLAGMTRALATELAPDGILVNCVSPGFVLTELTRRSLAPQEIMALAQQVPLGRFAAPQEIARFVAFIASDANTYLTGQNLVVDGGFSNV